MGLAMEVRSLKSNINECASYEYLADWNIIADLNVRNLLLIASPDPSTWPTEDVLAYTAARPVGLAPRKITQGT